MKWYLLAWRRYAQFHGRSPRREYWVFTLVNAAIFLVLFLAGAGFSMVNHAETGGITYILSTLYFLAVFIPSISCTVRRLHDMNKSGWWILISLIFIIGGVALLVMLAFEGTRGNNPYGPDPRVHARAAAIG
jgi:uncharacterized membrane protein YhaH (DUF805 family)